MRVKCTAPIRICDLGGWTDTWFAVSGRVLNLAVFPAVEVTASVTRRVGDVPQVRVTAENYGDSWVASQVPGIFSQHPLIEAGIQEFQELPEDWQLDLHIFSEAPAGASTGTSAAVSVALLGAIDQLLGPRRTSYELARLSHRIETEKLGYQAGIQDQLCSAYGGICYITMDNYPEASVAPLHLGNKLCWELESRLMLVYLGVPHASSSVHQSVIAGLESDPVRRQSLAPLRRCAEQGKEALLAGDLNRFGHVMIDNTEAQAALHPALVNATVRQIIEVVKGYGLAGYKVNGAGGDGGSLTLLLPSDTTRKRSIMSAIREAVPKASALPVRLAPMGLMRWVSE